MRVRATAVPSPMLWHFAWGGLIVAGVFGVLGRSVLLGVLVCATWLAMTGGYWLARILVAGLAALKPGQPPRVLLNAAGLHVFDRKGRRSIPWADLHDVYREGEGIVLVLRSGRGPAIHVPDIPEAKSFAAFLDEIMRRREDATSAGDPGQPHGVEGERASRPA